MCLVPVSVLFCRLEYLTPCYLTVTVHADRDGRSLKGRGLAGADPGFVQGGGQPRFC